MVTLNAVADELAGRVNEAFGEIHTRATEGGPVLSPQFLIVTPDFDYHVTARKTDFTLEAWVLVADTITDDAVRQLRTYAEADGIKAAIEGTDRTLGGLVDDCVVLRFRSLSADEYQMVAMWGGVFEIQIMGRT